MHRKIKLIIAFSLLVSVVFSLSSHRFVHAQEDKKSGTTNQTTTAYEYTVRPNDNLSILVRRSLQLYAQTKGISLSPATAMYSETLVTQRMGNPSLGTNQQVSVPFNLLEEFITSSKSLSEKQVAAWNRYAQSANFNLDSVAPTNASAAQQALTPQTSSAQTSDRSPTKQDEQKKEDQSEGTSKPSDSQDKWWWVVLLVVTVVLASFLYSSRPPSK